MASRGSSALKIDIFTSKKKIKAAGSLFLTEVTGRKAKRNINIYPGPISKVQGENPHPPAKNNNNSTTSLEWTATRETSDWPKDK